MAKHRKIGHFRLTRSQFGLLDILSLVPRSLVVFLCLLNGCVLDALRNALDKSDCREQCDSRRALQVAKDIEATQWQREEVQV